MGPRRRGRDAPAALPVVVEWRISAIVFALVLSVYLASMPRTVTFEDDGLFILSSYFAGVPHPPGYPLHAILGWLFTRVPLGSVAFRVHLMSAVFAAAACAVLWHLARRLGIRRASAAVGALAFGVSDAFWSQAIIAEVYSLHVLLFLLAAALCLEARLTGSRRALGAAALASGLALANHWPLFVVASPALVLILRPRWRDVVANAPRLLALGLLGLTPYVYLVLRSRTEPTVSFYGPIDTLERFWFLVTMRGYEGLRVNPYLGLASVLDQAVFWGRQLVLQFTGAGAALAALGAVVAWRRWPRDVAAAVLLAALAAPLAALVQVRQPMHDHLNRAVLRVYPLVSYAMMALWIALALDALRAWAAQRSAAGARAVMLAGLLLPPLVLAAHARANLRRHDTAAADYARAMLESFGPDAVVFVHSDLDTGPLGYLHLVEGVRPDVRLYNSQGHVFANRLGSVWEGGASLEEATRVFIDRQRTPVYSFPEPPPFFVGILLRGGIEDFGFYWRQDATLPPRQREAVADPRLMAYLDHVLAGGALTDAWSLHHRNRLIGQAGWMLGALVTRGGAERDPVLARRIERVAQHYLGRVRLVDSMHYLGVDPAVLLRQLEGAEALLDETFRAEDRELLPVLRGQLYERLGMSAQAVAQYEQALAECPDPRNPALAHLQRLYAQLGRSAEGSALQRRFNR